MPLRYPKPPEIFSPRMEMLNAPCPAKMDQVGTKSYLLFPHPTLVCTDDLAVASHLEDLASPVLDTTFYYVLFALSVLAAALGQFLLNHELHGDYGLCMYGRCHGFYADN